MESLRNRNPWPAFATLLGVGVVVLLVLGISGLSDLPGRPSAPDGKKPPTLTGTTPQERAAELTAAATDRLSETNEYNAELTAWASDRASRRTGSLALLAGAVALLTAALGAAAHGETVRKNRSDAKGAAATRADERFATAIEHLSSDQPGVQTGGIYSLEALAREDEDRIETVVQVLLAYTEPWWQRAREWADVPHGDEPYPATSRFRLAFEAAARSRTSEMIANFDLSFADLSGAALGGADLRDANLRGAVLIDADLRLAQLDDAVLDGANLTGADLEDAILLGARFEGANLHGARLDHAQLGYSTLTAAGLQRVDLRQVNLRGVSLERADLEGAIVFGVDLSETPTGGANLVGVRGLGSHPSHKILDLQAFFVGKRVRVFGDVAATANADLGTGTVKGVRFAVAGEVSSAGTLELHIQIDEASELLWVNNAKTRVEAGWPGAH